MATYKIISLRAQSNGFKQTDIKSAGLFSSFEDADKHAQKMNERGAIYTTYMAQKTFEKSAS